MSKNKVITTQFKLIEMSQTRARGWIEKYILRKTKLPLIVHVSVSKKPNKWDNKRYLIYLVHLYLNSVINNGVKNCLQSLIQCYPRDYVLVQTYMNALNFLFLIAWKTTRALCTYRIKQVPARHLAHFFFIRSLSRHHKTSKPRRESRNEGEFDHHRVKTNTQAFYG